MNKKKLIIYTYSNRYEVLNEKETKKLATIYNHENAFNMIDCFKKKYNVIYKVGT